MSIEMFLGGLIILTMVAVIVIAMTSTRNSGDDRFGEGQNRSGDCKSHAVQKRS